MFWKLYEFGAYIWVATNRPHVYDYTKDLMKEFVFYEYLGLQGLETINIERIHLNF